MPQTYRIALGWQRIALCLPDWRSSFRETRRGSHYYNSTGAALRVVSEKLPGIVGAWDFHKHKSRKRHRQRSFPSHILGETREVGPGIRGWYAKRGESAAPSKSLHRERYTFATAAIQIDSAFAPARSRRSAVEE